MSAPHRAVIDAKLYILVQLTKLSERLVNDCVAKGIMTRDDGKDIEVLRYISPKNKMNREFYNSKLRRVSAENFKIFYELAQAKETRQPNVVLDILKEGLDASIYFEPSSEELPSYNFENITTVDGSSFPEFRLPESTDSNITFPKYEMNGKRYALLVNIISFIDKNDRNGAQFDSLAMTKVLKRFRFEVLYGGDTQQVSAEDLKKTITAFKSKCKDGVACIVVIMSHGDRDVIITSNGGKININSDILEQFNNKNFEAFSGKPKLFFFQACRGNQHDEGVQPTMTDSFSKFQSAVSLKIPTWTDMLVCYSTLENQYSYREVDGSWFIQILCDKLKKYGSKVDICKILTLVAEGMKSVEGSGGEKQICPWTNIGFTKEFYF